MNRLALYQTVYCIKEIHVVAGIVQQISLTLNSNTHFFLGLGQSSQIRPEYNEESQKFSFGTTSIK